MMKDPTIQLHRTTADRTADGGHTLGAAQQATWDRYWSRHQSARHLWNLSTRIVRYFGPATPLCSIGSDRIDELVKTLWTCPGFVDTVVKLPALPVPAVARRPEG
jgi:hypothetical protein